MASPGRPWLALIQSIELLSGTLSTMDTFSNLAGERGKVWMKPRPPLAFLCQGSEDHPASEG